MAKSNLEEIAYQEIMKLILEHHVKPGDVLLETELTEKLQMRSRTPVRHALGQLVAKGFLEKKAKRGYNIPFPSKQDAEQVFFAREHIESLNAASAAINRTNEELKKVKELIKREADIGRSGDKNTYSLINESFHEIIAEISGNSYLQQYSKHLFWRSSFYIFYFGSYYTEQDFIPHMLSPPQHQAIVSAIESKDGDKAKELMQHHVHFTSQRVITKIPF